jgi:transposase
VLGLPRNSLFDTDECALTLQAMNRSYGKSGFNVRVREEGKYSRGIKYTLICSVCATGQIWFRLRRVNGTTVEAFTSYIQEVVDGLPPAEEGQKNLLWDNLSAHGNDMVLNVVYGAGHRVIARPPYRPWLGPIEFVFNQLQNASRLRDYAVDNGAQFVQIIPRILTNIQGIEATFTHCGYP